MSDTATTTEEPTTETIDTPYGSKDLLTGEELLRRIWPGRYEEN